MQVYTAHTKKRSTAVFAFPRTRLRTNTKKTRVGATQQPSRDPVDAHAGTASEVTVVASAPGKVILFGEHAVVYGKTAVGAAVSDLRIVVTAVRQAGRDSPRRNLAVGPCCRLLLPLFVFLSLVAFRWWRFVGKLWARFPGTACAGVGFLGWEGADGVSAAWSGRVQSSSGRGHDQVGHDHPPADAREISSSTWPADWPEKAAEVDRLRLE